MKDFKVGDKIKLVVNVGPCDESRANGGVRKGDILICVNDPEPLEGYRLGNGKVSCEWANCHKDYFEEKEMFDMKKEKWFIRTPTQESSRIAQEWLFSQGFAWQHHEDTEVRYTESLYLKLSPFTAGTFCHTDSIDLKYDQSKEIKLTTKTVVDSVEYPKTETPEQKQLQEVMLKISELQDQAAKLQGLISK